MVLSNCTDRSLTHASDGVRHRILRILRETLGVMIFLAKLFCVDGHDVLKK